jgi:hypothetical protein
MMHERIKYQEMDKNLDADLENKIKQLESQNPGKSEEV